ncbi:MAG: uroporphyrinogen-III C-methyltransferase [Candidatus Eremiobacteraeota bacterium]|nr:uroporphyrinogen-III C-methyltransferase [Candidatus Eremiobacteraeota bacterium]
MPTAKLGVLAARVSLVGAGPGDPGLLTLRATHALQHADVVLYDALVSDSVLALVPSACERIFVGKRGGDHAISQTAIEALTIEHARRGKRVVRLKGGDPFVFGRGAEEGEALRRAGVAFDVVPGITSAIAAPAYAGIPVTHREHASAFTVATGREDAAKSGATLDWNKLADSKRTLVFLMASSNLDDVAAALMAHGLSGSTPAAAVSDGTRPSQRTCTGTLASIAGDCKRASIAAPAVVVIGDVVRLRERIAWFDVGPLFGKRVLVTRAAAQTLEFVQALAAHGAEAIVAPTIAIEPPDDARAAHRSVDELATYAWVVFTSVNGVDAFFDRLASLDADARYVGGVKVAAIGERTAERLRSYGIRPDIVPAAFISEEIARALIEAAHPGARILVYRAQDARDILPQMLTDAGLEPTVVAAYRTVCVNDAEFVEKVARADVLAFTSASTVRGYVQQFDDAHRAVVAQREKVVACIGPVTAEAARQAGLSVDVVAETFTTDGLIEALALHFAAGS